MTNPDGSVPMSDGSIAGSALGAVAIGYDAYQESRDRKREIAARKAEAELAYQRSVDDWHRQNAYNTPEQQMARFGAAGLNPHLIYGQGSSGLAGSVNKYQSPDIQMQGYSPPYGSAVGSVLPMLMQVGTWMQNMRISEQTITGKDQVIDYLNEKYPHEIRGFNQKESLWPYQRDAVESGMHKSRIGVAEALEEYQHRYGRPFISKMGSTINIKPSESGGMRGLERILKAHQGRKTGLEADWLSPTRIFGMVNSVLGRFMKPGRVAPRGGGSARKVVERYDKSGRRVYKRSE